MQPLFSKTNLQYAGGDFKQGGGRAHLAGVTMREPLRGSRREMTVEVVMRSSSLSLPPPSSPTICTPGIRPSTGWPSTHARIKNLTARYTIIAHALCTAPGCSPAILKFGESGVHRFLDPLEGGLKGLGRRHERLDFRESAPLADAGEDGE